MRLRQIAAVVVVTLAAAAASTSAWAETIAYDRTALASPQAAEALRAAIAEAAERACRRETDGLSVLGSRARRAALEACVTETVATAERQAGLGRVQLAARE